MKIVRRLLLTITLLPPYLALPSAAFAQPWNYESGRGMPMMWGLWGIGMMFMHFVFWILLVVALVLGIRWLIRQGSESKSDSALGILRQRYARGEINKEEFETKKRDLS